MSKNKGTFKEIFFLAFAILFVLSILYLAFWKIKILFKF